MIAILTTIKDIATLVVPLILQFLKTLADKETREAALAVQTAKTEEEKREAIQKFANALHKS